MYRLTIVRLQVQPQTRRRRGLALRQRDGRLGRVQRPDPHEAALQPAQLLAAPRARRAATLALVAVRLEAAHVVGDGRRHLLDGRLDLGAGLHALRLAGLRQQAVGQALGGRPRLVEPLLRPPAEVGLAVAEAAAHRRRRDGAVGLARVEAAAGGGARRRRRGVELGGGPPHEGLRARRGAEDDGGRVAGAEAAEGGGLAAGAGPAGLARLLEDEAFAGHLGLLVPFGDCELLEGALHAELVFRHHTFALLELILGGLQQENTVSINIRKKRDNRGLN